jgi:hypothetical protein
MFSTYICKVHNGKTEIISPLSAVLEYMATHQVNTTGATSGAGTVYLSGPSEITCVNKIMNNE